MLTATILWRTSSFAINTNWIFDVLLFGQVAFELKAVPP
jgi:hypothetical protein